MITGVRHGRAVTMVGEATDLLGEFSMGGYLVAFLKMPHPPAFRYKGVRYEYDPNKRASIQRERVSFGGNAKEE